MNTDEDQSRSRFIQWGGYVLRWVAVCFVVCLGLVALSIASPGSALLDLVVIIPIACVFAFGTWWLRRWTLRSFVAPIKCCRCGYDMIHLPAPRCPECGAIVNFKHSAEEMGIQPTELSWNRVGSASQESLSERPNRSNTSPTHSEKH